MMQAQESPHAVASAFLAHLGPVVLPGVRLASERLAYAEGVFDAAWIGGVPLPMADEKPAGQTVALVDGLDFQRTTSVDDVERAYQDRPRTQVYESLDVRSDTWISLVSLHLTGMLRRRVICTAYASRAGDRTLDAHDDQWLGVIVQMQGAKRWLIRPARDSRPTEVFTRVGDVLILPQGMTHEVQTPDVPGHSVHLLFAVTDQPVPPPPQAPPPGTAWTPAR
ncbi:cupin domain-containing protein [Streptomyces sp. TG1A-8]|uniref:JmjC domain-containing protein n=1 Tax=Streptomyces sp. TG1A-8 TaxID=3051385 RepID=UPI00265C5861|nr:cupin domain-containing protein [Streptomyces sp. TG1A-8]MDO0927293.1 cupin domain-containing protein [Streptomyces sp. TG1A-8]